MSYENELNAEIDKELDRLAKLKQHWTAQFIAHAICKLHTDGLENGDHKNFWLHCGYDKVRSAVTKRINRRAGDKEEAESRQFILPGYDHLHSYYVVRRNGDDIGIPIEDMTDEEIDHKTSRYQDMGRSCFSHADEFQRFKRERRAAA